MLYSARESHSLGLPRKAWLRRRSSEKWEECGGGLADGEKIFDNALA